MLVSSVKRSSGKSLRHIMRHRSATNAWKLLVANIIAIIVLIATYVILFGFDSVKKYLVKDVIIIAHEEDSSSIHSPGDFNSTEIN